ncbi:MAG: hypothetical protein AAF410_05410 [Pseudomonadota bacterium]
MMPVNRADLVAEFINHFNEKENTKVQYKEESYELDELLTSHLEIRIPSKEFLADLAKRSGDDELQRLLENNDNEAINDFLWAKDCIDLLKAYPNDMTAAQFCELCKPLAPRAYSISSSISAHPDEVHLTVSSVRYDSFDREHHGVASTYLADIVDIDADVSGYFSPNKNFSVPDDDSIPIIMVGPGTGIAPFRAFLEERFARKATGENWLFFGDRNSQTDFLYQEELEKMQAEGVLSKMHVAFSRDQEQKIYVQDHMRENGAELFNWLEKGAYFYVCGDAFYMAKDVDKALYDVIAEHGKLDEKQTADYVAKLKKDKRYVRDVY